MTSQSGGSLGWPGRVAIAVVRDDPPRFFLAESDLVLSRVIALDLVAGTPSSDVADQRVLSDIRRALLEERWGDAVVAWMTATGSVVDVYPDEEIWTQERLGEEQIAFEVRLAPIFREPEDRS